jgi:hypothetical protein
MIEVTDDLPLLSPSRNRSSSVRHECFPTTPSRNIQSLSLLVALVEVVLESVEEYSQRFVAFLLLSKAPEWWKAKEQLMPR